MKGLYRRLFLAGLTAVLSCGVAVAQHSPYRGSYGPTIIPSQPCAPSVVPGPVVMPGTPAMPLPAAPGQPSLMPAQPGAMPAQPGAMPAQPGAAPAPAMPAPAAGDGGTASAAKGPALRAPAAGAGGTASAANWAAASPAGGEGGGSYAPNMIGDFSGFSVKTLVHVPQVVLVPIGGTNPANATRVVAVRRNVTRTVRVPAAGRAAFKIADNESPRPQDRVFVNFNYFSSVNDKVNRGVGNIDVYREVFGFEKTFMDGNASFGMRLPVVHQTGDGSLGSDDFGDISLVFKYALMNDPVTGGVFSTGMVLTVPTGPSLPTTSGNIDSVLFQPYLGYIYRADRFFTQGFSSLVIPTETQDVTLLFNDIAFGYTMYTGGGDSLVSSVAPALEFHLSTPLSNRGADNSPVGVPDMLVVTGGLHVGLGNSAFFTLGAAIPVTGPKPYDIEAVAQFNWRF